MTELNPLLRKALQKGSSVLDRGIDFVQTQTGKPIRWRTRDIVMAFRYPQPIARKLLASFLPGIVHLGSRSTIHRAKVDGFPVLTKDFNSNAEGKNCLANERRANDLFGSAPWKLPITSWTDSGFTMPALPTEARLDIAARRLSSREKEGIAIDCLEIAFEMFCAGAAHRDFHAGNFFLVDNSLLLGDFETLCEYDTSRIPFESSYDLTGEGIDSPFLTGNMHYSQVCPNSLERVLDTPLPIALDGFKERLLDELRAACRTFKSVTADQGEYQERRHSLSTERIYGSFALPHLSVPATRAQRDSAKRFSRFGVGGDQLRGRTLLDLGCNAGAMTFAAQEFSPRSCLGIEYDIDKVGIANKIAKFCGLSTTEFRQGNVDLLSAEELGVHDVVFCLAIEAHVTEPDRLYRLLGQVTGDLLLFEGNAGCDIELVASKLQAAGFRNVEMKGLCDDDIVAHNNIRPILVARK